MNNNQHPRPAFEKILEATCKYYNISELELIKNDRETNTVYRRKIIIALARQHTNMTYKKIANRIGLKDGSWLSKVAQEIELGKNIYPYISHDIKNIMQIFNSLV